LTGKIEVNLLTGRSLDQAVGLEIGKASKEYFNSVSCVELSKADVDTLKLEKDTTVEISTSHGRVVLSWRVSEGLSPGSAFVAYGPWINQILGSETNCTGTPQYKGVKAIVKPANGEHILTLLDLVKALKEAP
jgi:formylmethanofuran dehydrogenase subunit D